MHLTMTFDATSSPYPVGYEADDAERRSRLTVFFRLLLAIPLFLAAYVYGVVLCLTAFLAWFAIVLTGRWPRGLYRAEAWVLRFYARLHAYVYLVTDAYPPFGGGEHPEYPVRIAIAEPKPRYSRLKAFFRLLLAIPVMIIAYALNIVGELAAVLAWFAIVVTGRQPRSLQGMLDFSVAYYTRATAYFFLLTEEWPPFSL